MEAGPFGKIAKVIFAQAAYKSISRVCVITRKLDFIYRLLYVAYRRLQNHQRRHFSIS